MIDMAKTQRLFEKSYRGLYRQGKVAMTMAPEYPGSKTKTPICAYRGTDGSRCAFGHILPDRLYRKKMEANGCYSVIDYNDRTRAYYDGVNRDVLEEMQRAHDDLHLGAGVKPLKKAEFRKRITESYQKIATEHDLTMPPKPKL